MGVRSAAMIGREAELGELLAALGRAEGGGSQVVLVRGEAGIGKTRLVHELAASVPEGTVVAFGHAVPMTGAELPYGVVGDLLRSLVRRAGAETARAALGPQARVVAPLVPMLLDDVPPPLDRLALHAATQDLLLGLSADRTVVLVVEDAHWADESSLDLLAFWARTVVDGRLLLIVTTRDSADVDEARLRRIGDLRRLPNAVEVAVGPLSFADIAAQIQVLDQAARPELVNEIQRLSSGNPLYVEELLAGAAGDPSSFLRLDLAGRFTALSETTVGLVRLAALEPRPFEVADLVAVSRHRPSEVDVALDEAAERGVIEAAGGQMRFRHELLRRAAVDSSSVSHRAEGHRCWAEHLATRARGLADLVASAAHWREGGVRRAAFDGYRSAAETATRTAPSGEADALWRTTLSILHEDPSVASEEEYILVLGGTAAIPTDAMVYARLVEAEKAQPPRRGSLVELWATCADLSLGYWGPESARSEVTDDELDRLVSRLEAEQPSALVLCASADLARVLIVRGRWEAVARVIAVLERTATALPPWTVAGIDLLTYIRIVALRGPHDGALRLAIGEEALAASENRDWATRAFAHLHVGQELFYLGRFDEAISHFRACMALVPGEESEYIWTEGALLTASSLRMTGRWVEARDLARRCFAVAGLSRPELQWLAVERGDLVNRDRPFGDEVLEEARESPDYFEPGYIASAMTDVIDLASSDPAAASRRMVDLLPEFTSLQGYAGEVLAFASALTWRSDTAPAELSDIVVHLVERHLWHGPVDDAWRLHVEAHLSRAVGAEDADTWATVAAHWDELGVPYRGAEARLRQAEWLVDAGDRAPAEALLRDALESAERIGARGLVEEIRGLGRRARIALAAADAAHAADDRGGLTEREFEVLQLLVTGMTNEQIGGELYMSPKTASVHVSHILAKLGAANRTEVATVAHRQGLVRP